MLALEGGEITSGDGRVACWSGTALTLQSACGTQNWEHMTNGALKHKSGKCLKPTGEAFGR
jgi:hypothetical protein